MRYDDRILKPYTVAFHHGTPHGVVAAVHIPDSPEPVPEETLKQILPQEAEHARSLKGFRQVQFVGGRMAVREASRVLSFSPPPVLTDARGAPTFPETHCVSVSHKRTLALAMVSHRSGYCLGVDLEDYGPPRLGIAEKVLRPEELIAVRELSADRQWPAILLRFSIKEAIYKALDPYVRRYVGFHEVRVEPTLEGTAGVHFFLANDEGEFHADARYIWLERRLVTSVRIWKSPALDVEPVPVSG